MLKSQGLLMVITACKMKPYKEYRERTSGVGNTPLLPFSAHRG